MGGDMLAERLAEGPYLVIDFLPERVPAESPGCFFAVEEYFLGDAEEVGRFAKSASRIALKLACYFGAEAFGPTREEWSSDLAPSDLAKLVESAAKNGCGDARILFPEAECMLVVEGGSLNMTAYGSDERFRMLVGRLAQSEGLFCWEG